MTLAPGTRLGPFEIVAALGAGGMGEVYRARDTRLGRDVALKVLPASVAADHERLGRFDREARLLASLTHPHIATLHALEQLDGRPVLVMELVAGEDLTERINRGPLPLKEALRIAVQIAEGLEAAHEKGIVHRDLKPANVKLTEDGDVKVLDFGLAKAFTSDDPSSASAMNSPTLTAPATAQGIILGTAAYMSPEQARGRVADKRADIWAYGVVLFEMLTGQRLFQGETISDTLAAVLRQEIDFGALPAGTPPEIERLLRRCLERDRKNRLHDIADARIVVADVAAGKDSAAASVPAVTPVARASSRWWIAAGLVGGLLVGVGAMRWLSPRAVPEAAPRVLRFSVTAPGMESLRRPALAPDGSFVVFEGITGVQVELYLQRFDEAAPHRLERTQGGEGPFVSADGRWIGFFRNNTLEKIAVDGGDALVISKDVRSGPGAVWLPDGTIVLPGNWVSGLIAISASGQHRTLTKPDAARNERAHWFPTPLPDGRHILFTVQLRGAGLNSAEIAWLDLETGKYTIVMPGAVAMYVAPGYLVYLQAGAFRAIAFDAATGLTRGESVRVLDDARGVLPDGEPSSMTAGMDGSLAYVLGPRLFDSQLVWVSPGGATENLPFPARSYLDASLSPDGHRALAGVAEGGRYLIRVLDFDRKTDDALELDGNSWHGVWNPDGHRIAFRSQRRGDYDAFTKDLATGAKEEPLLVSDNDDSPHAWTPDGKAVLVMHSEDDGSYPTFLLEPGHPERMTKVLEIGGSLTLPSPDGHWLAFTDDRSGRLEVYVKPLAATGVIEKVSTGGAQAVAWSPTTKELYFARPPEILAATYREESGHFVVGPQRLWARVEHSDPDNIFAVGKDGRILLDLPPGPLPRPEIRVILGWPRELAEKLRARQ